LSSRAACRVIPAQAVIQISQHTISGFSPVRMRVNLRILSVGLMVGAAFQPRIVLTLVVQIAAGKPLPQSTNSILDFFLIDVVIS